MAREVTSIVEPPIPLSIAAPYTCLLPLPDFKNQNQAQEPRANNIPMKYVICKKKKKRFVVIKHLNMNTVKLLNLRDQISCFDENDILPHFNFGV